MGADTCLKMIPEIITLMEPHLMLESFKEILSLNENEGDLDGEKKGR